MAVKDKEYGMSKKLFSDLGQMFASNPIIRTKLVNKNISMRGSAMKVLKDVSTFYMTMMANQSYDRFARYADYCVTGDTIIATPEFECGFATIEQLLEKYPNGERFLVYGYNSETQKIEACYAHHPRYVKTDKVIDIILDDDSKVTTTPDHKFMKRDGEPILAIDLENGMSLMPFYKSKDKNGYWNIKLNNSKERSHDGEHRLVAETAYRKIEKGEDVHHINSIRFDNRPQNLKIISRVEHLLEHDHLFTKEYAIEYNKEKWADKEYRERFGKEHSNFMTEHNPAKSNVTFEDIKISAEKNDWLRFRVLKDLNISKTALENRLLDNKFYNWNEFCAANGIKRINSQPVPRKILSLEQIKEKTLPHSSLKNVSEDLNVSHSFVKKILKINGYNSFGEFKEKIFYNHKVKMIVDENKVRKVYNLTTDLGNFAIITNLKKTQQNGVVIFNCEMESLGELSAALNIYADECTTLDEQGRMIVVKTDDKKIQQILEEFFISTLNVNANLWHWTRNMCKYGDYFMLNNIIEGEGIVNTLMMPVNEVIREEGFNKDNPFAVRYRWQTRGNSDIEPFEISHFRLTGRENFLPYGQCQKNGMITTTYGIKELKNIVKGDEIISLDLITKKKVGAKVLDKIDSGVKQCYKVRTRHNETSMTEEHKSLVVRDKKFEYVYTKDLKIGDLLVISKEHNIEQQIPIDKTLPEKCYNGSWKNINNIPDFVDAEFAQLYGFMVGDGWITRNINVSIALGEYPELNQFYEKILSKYSGKKIRHTQSMRTIKENSASLVGSIMLSTILERMGFVGNCHTKRIPEWVFRAPIDIKKAFLQGLFDADGSAFTDKWNCTRYSFELANEELIKDIKCLIQCLGYKSGKICSRDRRDVVSYAYGNLVKKSQPSYYFYYFESKNEQVKKHDSGLDLDGFVTEPIISIEDDGEHETYDIYVDHPDHNFIINGIVVHNSVIEPARRPWRQLILLEDSMLVYRIVRAPERRVFNIEMGAASPEEEPLIIEKFRSNVTQQSIVDSAGRVEQRFNPMDMATDYYLPMRGGLGSKIEMLPGGAFNGDIDDVEYIQKKLIASLHIPRAFLGFEEALCLNSSTKISTFDDTSKVGYLTPENIKERLANGEKVYVYSSTEDGEPRVGEVTWCDKTKIADKLYKITLDNDKSFECTDNHPIMMRDGSYKRADEVRPGDSCMPLYDRLSAGSCYVKGYKQIYNNKSKRWEYVHRFVPKQLLGESAIEGKYIHHIDFNKLNNKIENLKPMTPSEHMSMHAKLAKHLMTEDCRDKLRAVMATPEYRKKTSESAKKSWEGRDDRRQIVAENNVKHGKREKMQAAYYKKYEDDPDWMKRIQAERKIERPKLDVMTKLISEEYLTLDQISAKVGCSPQYVLEAVRENGYSGWLDFCKKNGVHRMKKCYSFNIKDLKEVATQCATKKEFYDKSGGSRGSIENFFKKQGIDFNEWFKNRNYNHKVISVEIVDYNDWVWDLHVPGYNNFALEAGVFVHNSGKATLAQEDIRWGRTVQRVQRALVGELTRLAMIHLYSKGITNEDDLANFELSLTNPSNLSILQRMEVWGKKLEVSRAALDSGLPNQWVQEQLFGFTKEEFENNKKQRLDDAVFEAMIEKAKAGEQASTEGEEPQTDESFEQPNLAGVGTEDLYKHTGLGKYEEETGLNYVLHDIIDPLKERKERILNNKTILKELKETGSFDKLTYKFTTPKSILCEVVSKQSICGNGNCNPMKDVEPKKFAKFIK